MPGQGWFEPATADRPADGIVRIAGREGSQWRRVDRDALRPEWFATATDAADEAILIQRACDHAARFDLGAVTLGARRWDCRSRITLDPTSTILRGDGAVLDFGALPLPPPSDPLVTLVDLPEAPGWTHDLGVLRSAYGEADALQLPLSLDRPGRFRISFLLAALSGWQDYPALFVTVEDGQGTSQGGVTAIAPGLYSFEVPGNIGDARLTLRADASVRIDSLEVTEQGNREALLIAATADSPQYGHKWMEGFDIVGPGRDSGLHGVRFQTLNESKSSRLMMRDITIRDFDTGLVFSDRAYLVRGDNLRIACDTGLHFLGGSRDAGEMLSLTDSVIDGGAVALRSNGAEFVLSATSIDFVEQVFVGSGHVTLQGCHLELKRPTAPERPPFDLAQGHVDMRGGTFLITGDDFEAGNQCDHIFELRSRGATAAMDNVMIYNLRSQSGALAGGPGRLDVSRMRGRRPRHMAPLVQQVPERNLLGPLPLAVFTSDMAQGRLSPLVTEGQIIRAEPDLRHLWLVGHAPAGAEIGLSLDIRADSDGTVEATLQGIRGDERLSFGDSWQISVTTSWANYRNNIGDTHPSATFEGRMPDGCDAIALYLDLSALIDPVEIDEVFLCAV